MKYIITESQLKKLVENENKLFDFFQNFLDEKLKYLQKNCDYVSSETFGWDISFETCNELSQVEQIRLEDVKIVSTSIHPYDKEQKNIILHIVIDYRSVTPENFPNLITDLKGMIKNYMRSPIEISYESKNLAKLD